MAVRPRAVTTWAPDMEGLVDLVAHGGLAHAVAEASGAPDFSV